MLYTVYCATVRSEIAVQVRPHASPAAAAAATGAAEERGRWAWGAGESFFCGINLKQNSAPVYTEAVDLHR